MITHEDVEKLVKELNGSMFILGKNSIETDSFYIEVFPKVESED